VTKSRAFESLVMLALVFALSACDQKSSPTSAPPTVASAAPVTSAVPPASVAASVAPPAASSAPAPAVAPETATRWAGTYQSEKAKVATPDKVKDLTWTKDDGTAAIGSGTIKIEVTGTSVGGSSTGPLGNLIASGVYDGKELRVSLSPKDTAEPGAMRCSGVAELKDGALRGTLQCASANAVVVRKVSYELKPEG